MISKLLSKNDSYRIFKFSLVSLEDVKQEIVDLVVIKW